MKKWLIVTAVVAAAMGIVAGLWFGAGSYARGQEQKLNRVTNTLIPVSPRVQMSQHHLLVADMHADSLLFGRDLLERGTVGEVDLPRLREGGVGVQAFTVVTQAPSNMNIDGASGYDEITLLAVALHWPRLTWKSYLARALFQAEQLHALEQRSGGKFVILTSRSDVDQLMRARLSTPGLIGGWLGIEGAQALDGDITNLDKLYDAGFRMIGLAHFTDNDFAGSAHGAAKGGLTDYGKALVRAMEQRKIIVDLAHASPQTVTDTLAFARRPVVVSHTGVKATCDNNRNLSDDQLRGIAANGGLIGIGFWETAVCGKDARAIAKAIQHAVEIAGVDHVALGSDFDGAVTQPFDASHMDQITQALADEGLSEADVRKVMGENVVRFLRANLP